MSNGTTHEAEAVPWSIASQDVRSSLFPIAYIVDGYAQPQYNVAGIGLPHFAVSFEGPTVSYLIVDEQWKSASSQYFRRVQDNPGMLAEVLDNIHRTSDALLESAREIARAVSPQLTNKELLGLYQRFITFLREVYHFGLVPTFLDCKEYTYVTDLIGSILEERGVRKEDRGVVFATLTTPTFSWDFTIAEDELRQMISCVREHSVWKDAALSLSLDQLQGEHRELVELYELYCQRFGWLQYGYEGPLMSTTDLHRMVRERILRVGDDRSVRQSAERQHRQVEAQQQEAIARYGFSEEYVRWFALARRMAFYKSYRRLRQSQSYALLEPLLRLIAQRSGLPLELWRMLTPQEVERALESPWSPPDDLNDRRQLCVYGSVNGESFLLSGLGARQFVDHAIAHLPERQRPLLNGQVAYPGVVEGQVVVVRSPEDADDVPTGCIIVSPSLNPHMQLAMERCRAIVTDAGGLTCHAAIVAREYQIPCIVGVANATAQIHTGDYVRVDANHGVITILIQHHR